jgi:type III restriction enzyme
LRCIEETIGTVDGRSAIRFPNFSVEMETGTGKTYVYVRTALELFRRYGFRKFIVVVPSVAVREGVLKMLGVTRKHLLELYGNIPYRYYTYDSLSLSQVRQFVGSDSVEIMVMTLDSFNKAANVIRQETDRLQGETPIHLIQTARPILILDEPQNMESEKSVAALAALAPLLHFATALLTETLTTSSTG